MNIKKKLILLSSCLMLTGFALVRNVTKEDVQEVRAEEEKYFKQITSKEELICGEGEKYLIASIGDSLIFDGSLQTLDVEGNKFDVTINDSKQIDYSEELNKSTFTIEDAGSSKYYIKSSSGKYIGNTTTKNNLEESDNQKYSNTITINSDGSVDIISNNTYLRYNNDKKNGTRFRYYKSTSYMNQQPISLFKLNSASSEVILKKINLKQKH